MKPYLTSFMRVAAFLALLLSLTLAEEAKANDCGFSLSSNDQTWSFTAYPGTSQSRTLIITNTSTSSLTLNLAVSGSEAFGINHNHITLGAGDTTSVVITFHPGSTASGIVTGYLTITKDGTDCHATLGLSGTVQSN